MPNLSTLFDSESPYKIGFRGGLYLSVSVDFPNGRAFDAVFDIAKWVVAGDARAGATELIRIDRRRQQALTDLRPNARKPRQWVNED